MEETRISKSMTVADCRALIKSRNKEKISELIRDRFHERYLEPFKENNSNHGFTLIAVGCLMTESLQSFKDGMNNTVGGSEKAFVDFYQQSEYFEEMREIASDFYKHVRCGILHQAETTGGWRIKRKGELVDKANKIINAEIYLERLEKDLEKYIQSIQNGDDDSLFKNAIKKLEYICDNCEVKND